MELIYFDNAATSWPKPGGITEAMTAYHANVGASPGRSGHRLSLAAGRIMLSARESLANLFGIGDPLRIVFTKNATEALNLVIFGLLKPGDHCITSSMEHNALMRPLRTLESQGLEMTVIPCSEQGELDPGRIVPAIKSTTKAVFLTHASNVTGTIMPIAEVGRIARDHGLVFCVDAAQTAGTMPLDIEETGIDLLAFTGHKALFGPQGTGGLYIRPGIEDKLHPLMMGGTGSRSEFELQPDFLPDKYESGTPNTVGLAGLEAGVRFILETGIRAIREKEIQLTAEFLEGLRSIPGIALHGPVEASRRTAVVSFTLEGMHPSEVALALDEEFGILSRPGLHCAPAAHKTIGTFPIGTNRFSFGYFNTAEEITYTLEALAEMSRRVASG